MYIPSLNKGILVYVYGTCAHTLVVVHDKFQTIISSMFSDTGPLHTRLCEAVIARQQKRRKDTAKCDTSSKIENCVDGCTGEAFLWNERLRGQRRNDTEQSAPETRNTASSSANRSREDLGCPTVEDGIEHALEEVLQNVDSDVGSLGVDGAEDEDTGAHEAGGDDHSVLAADGRDVVHESAQQDTDDTRQVDVDVVAVSLLQADVDAAVLQSKNCWEISTSKSKPPEVAHISDPDENGDA